MEIRCYFCGRRATVEDTAGALARGWFTHSVSAGPVTIGRSDVQPVSMGFVCASCAAGLPKKGRAE